MCKVLYIKANSSADNGVNTFLISDNFVKEYSKNHPKDEITTIDLGKERIRSLSKNDMLSAIRHKKTEDKTHPVLKYAYQFAEADKYIVAEPLCGSGIPAILNYIDYVSIMDIAFKYTDYGSVGLLKGKKVVNIVSRGDRNHSGSFSFNELGEEYLKTIFSFFGITDFTTILADENGEEGPGFDETIHEAREEARSF
jgi:FMN-dependent NADH-azoreductase